MFSVARSVEIGGVTNKYTLISSNTNIIDNGLGNIENQGNLIISSLHGRTISSEIHNKVAAIVASEPDRFSLVSNSNGEKGKSFTLKSQFTHDEGRFRDLAVFVLGSFCCCLPLCDPTLRFAYKSLLKGNFEVSYQVQEQE